MSEIKVACPKCQQHIECDAGYSGMEISCPTCGTKMTVPQLAPMPVTTIACPGCGCALPAESSLCTSCGFNLKTGQAVQAGAPERRAASRKKKRGKTARRTDSTEAVWYRTPYPYIGLFGALLFCLFFLGKNSDGAMLACALLGLAYVFGTHVLIIVHAFKEDGAGAGFLCMCIPIYQLFYVYSKSESPLIKALFSLSLLVQVAFYFLPEVE